MALHRGSVTDLPEKQGKQCNDVLFIRSRKPEEPLVWPARWPKTESEEIGLLGHLRVLWCVDRELITRKGMSRM